MAGAWLAGARAETGTATKKGTTPNDQRANCERTLKNKADKKETPRETLSRGVITMTERNEH